MSGTFIFLLVIIMIACILLVFIVLSQNPKGGGLASTFGGGGTQMFGVERTTNFMDKATWTLATFIGIMIIISVSLASNPSKQEEVSIPNTSQTEKKKEASPKQEKETPANTNKPSEKKTPLSLPGK